MKLWLGMVARVCGDAVVEAILMAFRRTDHVLLWIIGGGPCSMAIAANTCTCLMLQPARLPALLRAMNGMGRMARDCATCDRGGRQPHTDGRSRAPTV